MLHGVLNELNPSRLPKWSRFSMYVFTLNLRPLRLMCCLPPEPQCSSAVGAATRKGPPSRVKTASADHPQTAPCVVAVGGTRSTGSVCLYRPLAHPPHFHLHLHLPHQPPPPTPGAPAAIRLDHVSRQSQRCGDIRAKGWYSNTPWKW